MKSVLLIDTGEDGLEMAKNLRSAEQARYNHNEDVCPIKEALSNPNNLSLGDRSRLPIKEEWKPHCIATSAHDIILLHTSNAFSKAYFEEFCKNKVVVLFSGDPPSAWPNDYGYTLPENARLFDRSREVLVNVADFVFEFQPGIDTPWEVLKGRSASSKMRDRLFATGLLADLISEAKAEVSFMEDLSGESFLTMVLERNLQDETLRDEARELLATRFVRWSLAGRAGESDGIGSEINTGDQAKQEVEQLLKLLCKPKR